MSDPAQSQSFVLLKAEVYERFKSLFEEDPVTESERRAHLEQFGNRAGWDDPAMDVYDDLDPELREADTLDRPDLKQLIERLHGN